MNPTARIPARRRPAFTLVELVAAMTVLAVVAAVLAPVMSAAGDAYASAVSLRRGTERAAFAMERAVQVLREAPAGVAAGTLGVSSASTSMVLFTDNRGLELEAGVLYLLDPAGRAVLCRGVTAFELTYLAADGQTSVIATPAQTQRFHVRLSASGVELRAAVFARARMVDP